MNPDVVICGASAGGLASARALGALGYEVLLVERQPAPVAIAKGELLQPESVRILDQWGVLAALRVGGAVPVGRLTIRDPSGRALLNLDYDVLSGEYRQIFCVEYATLLEALATDIDPAIRRGVVVTDLMRDSAGRVVGVKVSEGGRPYDIPARLVVAADGLSSRLRKAAGITGRRHEYGHRLLAFELAGVEVADEVCAYRTRRGLRLVYPLPGGRCRFYAQVRMDEFRGGMGDLRSWCEEMLAGVPALTPLADALRASLRRRQLLAVHRLRVAKLAIPGLALVGESAHSVHPMAAQGVNSTLGDAQVLAEQVAQADGLEPEQVDEALRAYHHTRAGRLNHTSTVSHNAARMLTATAGAGWFLGERMMRHTAKNARLSYLTAGNLAGVHLNPLTTVDRLYQFGVLTDPKAHVIPANPSADSGR